MSQRPEPFSVRILLGLTLGFTRQVILFEFSATWSCVSLPRTTTSSGWRLLTFASFENKKLQMLILKHTFYSQY